MEGGLKCRLEAGKEGVDEKIGEEKCGPHICHLKGIGLYCP